MYICIYIYIYIYLYIYRPIYVYTNIQFSNLSDMTIDFEDNINYLM